MHPQLKRYFKIDQHLARHFLYYIERLSSPPYFLCSQIITPFLNSMISTNQENVLVSYPIVEHPYSFLSYQTFLMIIEYHLIPYGLTIKRRKFIIDKQSPLQVSHNWLKYGPPYHD